MGGEFDFEFRALARAKRYREWIFEQFAPYLVGNVLEVGAGVGQFTQHVVEHPGVQEVCCIETDAAWVQQFQVRDPRVTLFHGTVQSFRQKCLFDTVISINVLEHIENDLDELKEWSKVLRPGQGKLCLLVPAREELYSRIDKQFGHYRRYTREMLRDRLLAAGYLVQKVYYFNFLGYFAWLINFRLREQVSFSEELVAMNDRFVVPIGRVVDFFLQGRGLGQSLIAVATPR